MTVTHPKAETHFRWLVLMYQLPSKPAYLRTKIWRRLQTLGAVQVRSSAYVLPAGDEAREDFHWLVQEIVKEGGEAVVCEARIVDGLTDIEIEEQFNAARDQAYAALLAEAETALANGVSRASVGRFRRRFDQIAAIDFFGASNRDTALGTIVSLEASVSTVAATRTRPPHDLIGRIWVTRQHVFVDRIACAWLVKRFIDPGARFKFVADPHYQPLANELRFDMFESEIGHEGDRCSLEVLIDRAGLAQDRGLAAIAEIVHDIDLKDDKFGRPETAGILHLLGGVCAPDRSDDQRIARATTIFNDLYDGYSRA